MIQNLHLNIYTLTLFKLRNGKDNRVAKLAKEALTASAKNLNIEEVKNAKLLKNTVKSLK